MTDITIKNLHQSLSKYILADGLDPIYDYEKSHDAYLYDARSGREYLDLFSFFATQPIGYNHPKMLTPDFVQKLGRLAVNRPTLSDVYTVEYAEFVETFGRLAGINKFNHFFFIEGGTLGVENAIKAAQDWKVRKNMALGKGQKGQQVIHFKEAFHGRSGYTLSLTNTNDPNKHQYFAKFSWPRIVNPKLEFPVTPEKMEKTIQLEKQAVREIEAAIQKNNDDIAAIIIEPIQAEGGDNHFRSEFLKELRRIADQYEIMLIFDEVQTGMGLTGKMWCHEHFGVTPDLVSFGKKVQVAGFMAARRIDEVKDNVFHVPSRINSTWGGNLIDMIRCKKYLDIIEEEHLIENAKTMGEYFLKQLQNWSVKRSRISNVRGRGLMIAFDLPDTELRNQMRSKIFENGAIALGCGSHSIRLRPHLDISRDHIHHAMDILEKAELAL